MYGGRPSKHPCCPRWRGAKALRGIKRGQAASCERCGRRRAKWLGGGLRCGRKALPCTLPVRSVAGKALLGACRALERLRCERRRAVGKTLRNGLLRRAALEVRRLRSGLLCLNHLMHGFAETHVLVSRHQPFQCRERLGRFGVFVCCQAQRRLLTAERRSFARFSGFVGRASFGVRSRRLLAGLLV